MYWPFVAHELLLRWRRTLAAILGVGCAVVLALTSFSLAGAFRQAATAPLADLHANVAVQRAGDVPEVLTGVVFPCSAVTISSQEIAAIRALPGVRQVGQAVLLWVFNPDDFAAVLGVDTHSAFGDGLMKTIVVNGTPPDGEGTQAVVDVAYARQSGLGIGSAVLLGGRSFSITGLADASREATVASANVYVDIAAAGELAAAAPAIQQISPFTSGDANFLALTVDPARTAAVADALRHLLGSKASVTTPETFLNALGSVFAVLERFSVLAWGIPLVIGLAFVLKTVAGAVAERARDIGVLKAVGWRLGDVVRQLAAESALIGLLGGLFGVAASLVLVGLAARTSVEVPIPWELRPFPHFLPGGDQETVKMVFLPASLSLPLVLCTPLVSMAIGAIAAACMAGSIAAIKPSELLRHE